MPSLPPLRPGPGPLLEVRRLCKCFPGVRALDQVDLLLGSGEILAVVGENGAGKSTLMKILAGIELPDAGQILLDGRPTRIDSVRTAERLGVALIHQELNLSDNLSVAANIFLGREPHRFGLIRRRQVEQEAEGFMEQVGLDCSPREIVGALSLGRQQLVEIAKALSVNARILIMDEPTSSLSQRETERLFGVIQSLRDRHVSILYISHRLGEVQRLADRVLVLRDGKNAGELARGEVEHQRLVHLMVGRDVARFYQRGSRAPGAPVLEADELRTRGHPACPLSLTLRRGEIVGLAGLVGAGRTELLRVLFGVEPPLAGAIRLGGRPLRMRGPADAIRAGLALVPEDRQEQGLILEMAVRENLTLASLERNQRRGLLDSDGERAQAGRLIRELDIRALSIDQQTRHLSGGNQQKVVLGKWLALRPRVLLLDEPTRGIDVGAKQEIYRLVDRLAGEGVAILFASSELEEILHLSDRVLVMHEGLLAGELQGGELSEETVLGLATGRSGPTST